MAMNRFLYNLSVLLVLCVLGGCSRPQVIPDSELELIFRDLYLTNAYCDLKGLESDTLDVYEPVFAAYGYTSQDMVHTVRSFSRRKSARLSDVVQAAINRLETESNFYDGRVRTMDAVDSIAVALTRRTLMADSSVTVRRIADTGRLRLSIAPVEPGEYVIVYRYRLDSLDLNERLVAIHALWDSTGRRRTMTTNWLRKGERRPYVTSLNARPGDSALLIRLGNYGPKLRRPYLEVDSIHIEWTAPLDVALRRLTDSLRYRLAIDSLVWPFGLSDSVRPLRGAPIAPPFAPPVDMLALARDSLVVGPDSLAVGTDAPARVVPEADTLARGVERDSLLRAGAGRP